MLDGVASSLYVIMQYYQAVRIRKKFSTLVTSLTIQTFNGQMSLYVFTFFVVIA